jgi:excinuclease UvrABC nuclease subunit
VTVRSLQKYGYLRWDRRDPFPVVKFAQEPGNADQYESFGPFRLAAGGRNELRAVREVFPTRNCRGKLNPTAAFSPCLEHPLGRCGAPCTMLQSPADYQGVLERLRLFLRGDKTVLATLRGEIALAAKREQFERAAVLRDRYRVVASIAQAVRREAGSVIAGDRLLVLPAAEAGLVRLYWFRPGAPLTSSRAAATTTDWTPVLTQLQRLPQAADQGSLDEGRLTEHWLRRKTSAPVLRVADYPGLSQLAVALSELVRSGHWRRFGTPVQEAPGLL